MHDALFQQLINWLTLGCIYSLLALGFSLLFGVLQVIHFSHGDVAMVAPFIALAAVQALVAALGGAAPWLVLGLACLVAIAAVGGLGVALDRLVISRFRNAPAMMPLVATVALGIVIRELIRHLYPQGSNPHAFPAIAQGAVPTPFGPLPLIIVVSVLVDHFGLMGLGARPVNATRLAGVALILGGVLLVVQGGTARAAAAP